ncbi:MAG TPA: caspase family protein, partial [Thioploca sp.]|nr:caspase family protein [Thioploca sp.]
MFRYIAVFISFIFLFNTPAYAASRVALVIGNANYQKISRLNNTINDADDMEQVLRELDFEVIKVTDGTKRQMLDAVYEFTQKLQRGGQVGLFYFSGHGVQKDGRNYLMPVKTNIRTAADLEFEAVDAGRVLANLKQTGDALNIIILDACRDNPFKGLLGFKSFGERGLARVRAISSSIVAYATEPGNVAIE